MKQRILFTTLVIGSLLGLPGRAPAQFFRGYGYDGWGGTNGGAALLADYRQATAMQLKAQSMQAGQQAAMAQNYVVQSGIRNTLSSQAQSQTNCDPEPAAGDKGLVVSASVAGNVATEGRGDGVWGTGGPGGLCAGGRTAPGRHGHHQVAAVLQGRALPRSGPRSKPLSP